MNAIRRVASYESESLPWGSSLAVGQKIAPTVDILTLCGQVQLVHAEHSQLESDLAVVQALIDGGLFEVAPPNEVSGKRRARTISSDLQISPAYEPPPTASGPRTGWMLGGGSLALALACTLAATTHYLSN